MITYEQYRPKPPLDELEKIGDPREYSRSQTVNPEFLKSINIGPEHIPALIELSKKWYRTEGWPENEEDTTVYAPIFAWHALGHLKAIEAVESFLAMLDTADESEDDWYLEELPDVFANIGPDAILQLTQYMKETSNKLFPRICSADGLTKIAQKYPETRDEIVEILAEQLSHYETNDEDYNGLIIHNLLDLRATEKAELIERAYAADRVELFINGPWASVEEELGIEGLGLVPRKLRNINPMSRFSKPGKYLEAGSDQGPTSNKTKAQSKKKKAKARKKLQKKSSRKNRRK